MIADAPLITVIVPVHDGADVLPRTLAAIAASDIDHDAWELIVVDDASSDDSAVIAGRYADTVIKLAGRPRGPAYARNRALELARGEIIISIDADVCVHPDALSKLAQRLTSDATLGGVVGAYDGDSHTRDIVSNFRNLRQSFLQRRAAGDVDQFWPALGALRRAVLSEVGNFDEWHYWRPQAEGAELGERIRAAGFRILLDPDIQATHLKQWTLTSSVATDLVNHGVPWMRLLYQRRHVAGARAPNLSTREKVNAALTCAAVLAVMLHVVAPFPVLPRFALADGVGALIGVAPLFGFLAQERDPLFAVLCLPLQLLQYVVAGTSVVVAWFLHRIVGEPRRDVTDDAFAEIGLETWPPVPRRLPSDAWKPPAEKS